MSAARGLCRRPPMLMHETGGTGVRSCSYSADLAFLLFICCCCCCCCCLMKLLIDLFMSLFVWLCLLYLFSADLAFPDRSVVPRIFARAQPLAPTRRVQIRGCDRIGMQLSTRLTLTHSIHVSVECFYLCGAGLMLCIRTRGCMHAFILPCDGLLHMFLPPPDLLWLQMTVIWSPTASKMSSRILLIDLDGRTAPRRVVGLGGHL